MTISNRRKFLKGLTAGAAIAGLPAATEVKRLEARENDIVVLKFDRCLSSAEFAHIHKHWKETFPEIPLLILDAGTDIEVLRRA